MLQRSREYTAGMIIPMKLTCKTVITDLLIRNYCDENGNVCNLTGFTPFEDGRLRSDLKSDLGFRHIDGTEAVWLRITNTNSVTITAEDDSPLSWNHHFSDIDKLIDKNLNYQVIVLGFTCDELIAQTYPRMTRKRNTEPDVIELVPLPCPYAGDDYFLHREAWAH